MALYFAIYFFAICIGFTVAAFSWFFGFAAGLELVDGVAIGRGGKIMSRLGLWLAQSHNRKAQEIEQEIEDAMNQIPHATPQDLARLRDNRKINPWTGLLCPICRAMHLLNFCYLLWAVYLMFAGGFMFGPFVSMWLLSGAVCMFTTLIFNNHHQ